MGGSFQQLLISSSCDYLIHATEPAFTHCNKYGEYVYSVMQRL
jgi:hypothetical protein